MLRLVCFLLVVGSSWLMAIPDTDQELANAGGADRVLKNLVTSKDKENLLITESWMDEELESILSTDPAAADLMVQDLNRGDGLLADAVAKAHTAINLNLTTGIEETKTWASGGPRQYWSAIVSTPKAIAALRTYFTLSPNFVCHVASATDAWLNKGEQRLPDAVMLTGLKAAGWQNRPRPASLEERWECVRLLSAGPVTGGAINLIRSYPASDNIYDYIWSRLDRTVDEDPALLKEFWDRASHCERAYDSIDETLQRQLLTDEGMSFFMGYVGYEKSGDQDRLFGRSELLWNAVGPSTPNGIRLAVGAMTVSGGRDTLVRLMRSAHDYTDFLLWHLTRPSESLSLAIRSALSASLLTDEPMARTTLSAVWDIGPDFGRQLETSAVWQTTAVTAGKSASQIRQELSQGQLTREEVLSVAGVIGHYFLVSDDAWSSTFARGRTASDAFLGRLLPDLVRNNPSLAGVFADTFLGNDPEMHLQFSRYMNSEALQRVRPEALDPWLHRASDQLHSPTGIVGGVTEGSQFLDSLTNWLSGSGWEFAKKRLKFESVVPHDLRTLIVESWIEDREGFWNFYSETCCLPISSSALSRVSSFLVSSGASEQCLTAISQFRMDVSDSMDPVWDVFWSKTLIRDQLLGNVLDGNSFSDLNPVKLAGINDCLSRPKTHTLMVKLASGLGIAESALPTVLSDGRDQSDQLVKLWSQSPVFMDQFQSSVLSAIKYGGFSPPIASAISSHTEYLKAWRDSFTEAVPKYPPLVRALLRSLGRSRSGEVMWDKEIAKMEEGVMQIIVSDRIFFEGLITDKTGGILSYAQNLQPQDH